MTKSAQSTGLAAVSDADGAVMSTVDVLAAASPVDR
jgi:hypothetical protein